VLSDAALALPDAGDAILADVNTLLNTGDITGEVSAALGASPYLPAGLFAASGA
jgi:hypothetical protein